MRRLALVPILVTAFLYPPAASALGLGDIEFRSALNQRLDAEIPLRGVPAELGDDIIVTLASEQAFQDAGLQRPVSLTRLRFRVEQRPGGGYFIHVTSREAIVKPFLNFLIEVDWPGGNLLREYTVLLDRPVFTTEKTDEIAGGDAPATAAGAGMPGEIERDDETDVAATDTLATAEERDGDFGDTPVFLQVEREEEEAERRAAASGGGASGAGRDGEELIRWKDRRQVAYGPVREGEDLWNIASRIKAEDMTVQQMMLALLRYNPEAFAEDNINRLKHGYVLRVPDASEIRRVSAQQAIARVGEQNAIWEEWRRGQAGGPTRQAARDGSGTGAAEEMTASAERSDTRLRIVGSSANGGTGSDEQASATGGASASARAQLKQTREQLESAEMEKAELKSRIEALEQTVEKMERLITLREDRLARLQEQLKELRQNQGASEAEGTQKDTDDAAGATGGDAGGTGSGEG